MKKIFMNICLVIVTLVGLYLVFRPFINYNKEKAAQSYIVQNYDETVVKMEKKNLDEEWFRAQSYNKQNLGIEIQDPFSSDVQVQDPEYLSYLSVLNVEGDSVMSRLAIPRIKVTIPIFHGTSEHILQRGAGHLEGTALPVGGFGAHSVITGHTGLKSAKMFTDLTELEIGDEFFITTLDRTLAYRIDKISIVDPDDTSEIMPVEEKDYVTLLTCTPYGVNSHRLLVRGERIDYTDEEMQQIIRNTKSAFGLEEILVYGGIALLLLFAAAVMISKRKRKK